VKVRFGTRTLELGGRYIAAELRDSNGILDRPALLRERLDEDGYLVIRGLQDRDQVLAARRAILERLAGRGVLDAAAPVEEGAVREDAAAALTTTVRGKEDLKKLTAFQELAQARAPFAFFERLLGGEVRSLDFQWLRTAGPGAESPLHYDVVFMGRGTKNLFTCWTPLGDVSLDMGPLAICEGSHRFEKLKRTYGEMDVDRDLIEGHYSKDPVEVVDRFGGRWLTSSFRAGDVVVFGMYTLHGSLANRTNRLRISFDARYQLASEPVDERWVGENPVTHYNFWKPGADLEPVEVSRAKWGV